MPKKIIHRMGGAEAALMVLPVSNALLTCKSAGQRAVLRRRVQESHKKCRTQRVGAVAVEMAIVLPLLLVLVFGIIEFGRLMMVQQILVNTAREAARRAVVLEQQTSRFMELLQAI